jgi:7-keto-8-aminopelargonate synthetase-like enzyme
VAGPKAVIDRVRRTPPALGATPISPPMSAAAIAAIDIVEHEPERRARLFENARCLRQAFARLSLRTGGEPTPIVPVHFADAEEAQAASQALLKVGVQVPWFDYGAGDDPGLLRAAARAVQTPAEIGRFEAALTDFLSHR